MPVKKLGNKKFIPEGNFTQKCKQNNAQLGINCIKCNIEYHAIVIGVLGKYIDNGWCLFHLKNTKNGGENM